MPPVSPDPSAHPAATPRHDGRQATELRPVRFLWDPMGFALASVTIETGRTRVLCSVCLEEEGWLSAEYRLCRPPPPAASGGSCSSSPAAPRRSSG
jgi:ribonuclease PH